MKLCVQHALMLLFAIMDLCSPIWLYWVIGNCHKETFMFNNNDHAIFSPRPIGSAEYCDERVCLCLCVFVSPRSYFRNYTSDLH